MKNLSLFANRDDAAQRLIQYLFPEHRENILVLAIPRGGVPVAAIIARHYQLPMDLMMVKKICMPGHSELAIGAVSLLSEIIDPRFSVDADYLTGEVLRIRQQLKQRYQSLARKSHAFPLTSKEVWIVDDGIATGNTMAAAIQMARSQQASKVVVIVPVASHTAWKWMKSLADEVVCILHPKDFNAVGQYYVDFGQVEDSEVQALMNHQIQSINYHE